MALREYQPQQGFLFWAPPQDVLPPDHLCYVIDDLVEHLDLSPLPDRSKTPGSPAYDPRLLLKVLIYGYATGTVSSRRLMQACREQLPYTVLTRQQYPDHRTISDFRKDNREFIQKVFSQIVRVARDVGLARLGTVAIDSTRLRANASREKTIRTDALTEEFARVMAEAEDLDRREDEERRSEGSDDDHTGGTGSREEFRRKLRKVLTKQKRLEQARDEVKDTKRQSVNLTDPETTFEQSGRALLPSYSAHATTTEDGIIVDAFVHNNPADYEGIPLSIEHIESRLGERPGCVLADSGFYSCRNIAFLKERGIDVYMPSAQQAHDAKDMYEPWGYSKDKFTYDETRDVYICPQGHALSLCSVNRKQGNRQYRRKSCDGCPALSECVRGKKPYRRLTRRDDEELTEDLRLRMESPEGKQRYGRRKVMIEPVFGHFKKNLGFRQFLTRGRNRVETEWLLLCIGSNVGKIARAIAGRRLPAGPSAGKPTAPLSGGNPTRSLQAGSGLLWRLFAKFRQIIMGTGIQIPIMRSIFA